LAVIASAGLFAYLNSPGQPQKLSIARATDRELLQSYRSGDWQAAMAELKRRATGYGYSEATDLALDVLEVGFWVQSDRHIHTEFFVESAAFLPKSLADWVQAEGPRRREALANSITNFVKDQRLHAESGEAVDIAALEELYKDFQTPDRYPQFWSPYPECGFDDRFPELIKMEIRHTLEFGFPGGVEALKRLGVNP
jgi:hypothetical protein